MDFSNFDIIWVEWCTYPSETGISKHRHEFFHFLYVDSGEGEISVVNLKCDTRLIGSFREEPGIFPGWHMNKAHWLTVALDGTVDDEKIKFLVDMSYELTKK